MNKIKGLFAKTKSGSKLHGGEAASYHGVGYDVKEKELPKIHKAAFLGDVAKVKQLAKKDSSSLDKEYR